MDTLLVPMCRTGTEPFYHTSKTLNEISTDTWLLKEVKIVYWKVEAVIFEGQISCLGSNGQIRLQHIKYKNNIYCNILKKHHSWWFHYKMIQKIIYNNMDITNEIIDILKYKICQQIMYFYNIKAIHQIHQIKTSDAKFLYDINRVNKHLITKTNRNELYSSCSAAETYSYVDVSLKRTLPLTEQRRNLYFDKEQLMKLLQNYYKILKQNEEETHPKNEDEKHSEKIEYKDYMCWDKQHITNEIETNAFGTKLGFGDVETNKQSVKNQLFDTNEWKMCKKQRPKSALRMKFYKGTSRFYKGRLKRNVISRTVPKENKFTSNKIKDKWSRDNSNDNLGKVYSKFKKLKKKQKRIATNKDTNNAVYQLKMGI